MGLISNPNNKIVVNISDKAIHNTVIKRKAEVTQLVYDLMNKSVIIRFNVIPYSNDEGEFGDTLSDLAGFAVQPKQLVADMTTLVEIPSGTPIGSSNLLQLASSFEPFQENGRLISPVVLDENGNVVTPAQYEDIPEGILYNKDFMYEFEFYKMVASTQPAIIDELIIGVIQRADADGRI
jgi:hypothetical protein